MPLESVDLTIFIQLGNFSMAVSSLGYFDISSSQQAHLSRTIILHVQLVEVPPHPQVPDALPTASTGEQTQGLTNAKQAPCPEPSPQLPNDQLLCDTFSSVRLWGVSLVLCSCSVTQLVSCQLDTNQRYQRRGTLTRGTASRQECEAFS